MILHLSQKTIRILNYCRLYLKVMRLSDMVTADGTQILPQFWDGTSPSEWTTLRWPVQARPDEAAWNVWKRTLRTLCRYGRRLTNTLGLWGRTNHMKCAWEYNHHLQMVRYSHNGNSIHYQATLNKCIFSLHRFLL